jgi:Bacterial HORMA domain family 1
MSSTFTTTTTYTKTDVAKVVSRFAADLDMIRMATGLMEPTRLSDVVHDVELMAVRGYLNRVDVVLRDAHEVELRAASYSVSTSASGWSSDRPGNNLWPRTPGGSLHIVVSYSGAWFALTEFQRQRFHTGECRRPWGASDIDTSYPGMSATQDRRYASNAYGLERTTYGR